MNRFDNPFHDLWVTEILSPPDYVRMFSPFIATHAEEIFSTGNVVVKGRQGSGKSMLLGLLSTRIRVAYARAKESYPAPAIERHNKSFICAGIHLVREKAAIVASRLSEIPEEKRADWAAKTFADYINYLLVKDLLGNVVYLANEQARDGVLSGELNINWGEEYQGKLLSLLLDSEAWYGYLDGCASISEVIGRVDQRLLCYKRYFNLNVDQMDPYVEKTRTDIGEPAAALADCLRKAKIIPTDALVFLRIDQHEELFELENSYGCSRLFRKVINRALAMRDGRVAYRIGTRHYAWDDEKEVWGSGASLEVMRDYSIVDIDAILRRRENPVTREIFNNFARDVFRRRLIVYGVELSKQQQEDSLKVIFGDSVTPRERAKKYLNKRNRRKAFPDDWSKEWRDYIGDLWAIDPLSAKLGEAWLMQSAQQKQGVHKDGSLPKCSVWEQKPYWVKERNEAALMQIAGEAGEMMIWSGARHILDLAGTNILAFMTICRSIWAAWLRQTSAEDLLKVKVPHIEERAQIVGIKEASEIWRDKLKEGSKPGREDFIVALGDLFSKTLRNDRSLSNPGHNGISLIKADMKGDHQIVELLKYCRDQGDLIEFEHTTKLKDFKPRTKWYLNPLLCPSFRIPIVRTKEPIYTTLEKLGAVIDGKLRANSWLEPLGGGQVDLF